MLFLKIKYHSTNFNKSLIKRNTLSSFFWIVIILILFTIFYTIKDVKNINSSSQFEMNINKAQRYALLFFSSLVGMIALIYLIDALSIIFKKNRLSFIDILSSSRYVEDKKYPINQDLIILYPFKTKHKQVIWTFKE